MEMVCEICGQQFHAGKARFCSRVCSLQYVQSLHVGMKRSEETRRKISEAAKRRFEDPVQREKVAEQLKLARERLKTEEVRQKWSNAQRNRWAKFSPEERERIMRPAIEAGAAAVKGRPISSEHKEKVRIGLQKAWADPIARETWMKNNRDPGYRQQRSEIAKRQWESLTNEGREDRRKILKLASVEACEKSKGIPLTDEHRQKISATAKNTWNSISPEERARRIQRLTAVGPSSLEKTICQVIDVIGIAYETQVVFAGGKYVADIYIPEKKLVIECNGNYWHNLPERIKRDRKFEAFLTRNGYKVLWLWQRDILKDPEQALLNGLAQVMEV